MVIGMQMTDEKLKEKKKLCRWERQIQQNDTKYY